MKTITVTKIQFLTIFFLLIVNLFSQDNWNFPADSATIGIFFCDFQSGEFEGGSIGNYSSCDSSGSINLPLDTYPLDIPLDYNFQDGDQGSRWEDFTYSCTGELVFSAHVLSSDTGAIYYPVIIPCDSFGTGNSYVPLPISLAWIDPSQIEEDYPNLYPIFQSSWNSLANLTLINRFAQSEIQICTYFYVPLTNDYSTAKTVIFIFRPAVTCTSTIDLSDKTYEPSSTAFPNPFNTSTVIRYSLPSEGNVIIRFYNILGENITSIPLGFQDTGTHSMQYIPQQYHSGILFYSIGLDGNYSRTKSIILVK